MNFVGYGSGIYILKLCTVLLDVRLQINKRLFKIELEFENIVSIGLLPYEDYECGHIYCFRLPLQVEFI